VKIPQPVGKAEQPLPPDSCVVLWSVQNGKMVKSWPVQGKQVGLYRESPVTNCAVPLESRATMLVVLPYNVTGNGRLICVTQSSQWLPMSVVPGTMVSVPGVMKYWQAFAVGVGVGLGLDVAVGVGVGVAVGVGAGVGVRVGVAVGVGLGVGLGLGVAVGVGVGVGLGLGVGVAVGFGVGVGVVPPTWTIFATEGTPLEFRMNSM
jgi:hypothetical protein